MSTHDTHTIEVLANADLCEWDPVNNRLAEGIPHRFGYCCYTGCRNPAELILGHDGGWRLCRACAALPRFRRYRVRREVKR